MLDSFETAIRKKKRQTDNRYSYCLLRIPVFCHHNRQYSGKNSSEVVNVHRLQIQKYIVAIETVW